MDTAVQKALDELSSLVACLSSPELFQSSALSRLRLVKAIEELKREGPEAVEAFCRAATGPAAVLASYSPPPPVDWDTAYLQLQQVSMGCYAAAQLLGLLWDKALCGRLGSSLTYRLAACSR